ncbi:ribosomal protein S18 acetylase RimI-like enzyme [Tritonibacter scottomollicae]|uniref:Ribosomal protein S18 acetylase RimI-like enzyme n=2 Tax=Tritonibacter scottomollicae TaxID=483013 RepID=A0A2T1ANM6_TRISK|nr:ribosomal protein S18 acetylase RimI-like enzyme [Tritonibacter scottomollicae]
MTLKSATPIPALTHAASLGISLREMTARDMQFLAQVYRSTREEELALTPWNEDQKHAFISMQFRAQHEHYQAHYPDALWLIIQRSGEAIGRLYLERWQSEHRIIDIALLPAHRGAGIGGAILRDLTDEASAANKAVGIHVEKANPAMALYHRLGFVTVEDKGVYDLLRRSTDAKAIR